MRSGRACRRRSRRCRSATVSRVVTWSSSARSCSAPRIHWWRSTRSSTAPATRSANRTTGLLAAVSAARALNVDETGWRLKGSTAHAVGRVHRDQIAGLQDHPEPSRAPRPRAARRPPGDRDLAIVGGPTTTCRWRVAKICWSHLQRDFHAHAEGSGAEHELGQPACASASDVFWAWEVYQHTHDRPQLQRHDPPAATRAQADPPPVPRQSTPLQTQPRPRRNLLKAWPALWTFATHARRDTRPTTTPSAASAAPSSTASSPSAANPNTASAESNGSSQRSITCRLQHRSLFAYLTEPPHRPRPRRPAPTTRLNPTN